MGWGYEEGTLRGRLLYRIRLLSHDLHQVPNLVAFLKGKGKPNREISPDFDFCEKFKLFICLCGKETKIFWL